MAGQRFHRFIIEVLRPLRLPRDEQQALDDEMRDHFAAYINDLTQLGLSEAEAEAAAQADFGSTNELAGAFLQIYRANRRRRIMRVSAWGIGGMVAATVLAMAFWPDSPRLAGLQRAIAQGAGGSAGFAGAGTATRDDSNEQESIEAFNRYAKQKLATRLEVEFEDMPLQAALAKIAEDLDLEILPQRKELEEAGVALDAPVSIKLKRVRGDVLLEFVLRQASPDAGYVVRDGIVLVSAKNALADHQAIRVYNCRDLITMSIEAAQNSSPSSGAIPPMMGGAPDTGLGKHHFGGVIGGGRGGAEGPGSGDGEAGNPPPSGAAEAQPGAPALGGGGSMSGPGAMMGRMGMPGGGAGGMGGGIGSGTPNVPRTPHVAQLLRLIETTVAPESWEINGGPGTVEEFSGLLVVNQSEDVHDRIEKMLEMVRKAGNK